MSIKTVNVDDILQLTRDIVREAAESNMHRRLIYTTEKGVEIGVVKEALKELSRALGKRIEVLYSYSHDYSRIQSLINDLNALECINLNVYDYRDTQYILGLTFDALVIDATYHLEPDFLGMLVEMVRGKGLIIIVGPTIDRLDEYKEGYHKDIVALPFDIKDAKMRFEYRMLKHTIGYPCTLYIDPPTVIKGNNIEHEAIKQEQSISYENTSFAKQLYDLCITYDQKNALRYAEAILSRKNVALVLKANRGRGKSAVLGLIAAGLIAKKRLRIVVTSPQPTNVQTFFEFAIKGLQALNISIKEVKKTTIKIGEHNHNNSNNITVDVIKEVITDRGKIFYRHPLASIYADAKVVLVDEAAGVPIPILLTLRRRFSRAIYASTVHGYEGTGRAFAIRFLARLSRELKQDLIIIDMKEPIRYADNDPIERWLYDILLLDAEATVLDDKDKSIKPDDCLYVKIDRDELFFNRGDDMLKQLVGLLVMTHYRNKPNDLVLMGNAPHHMLRAVTIPSGKVIGALHICIEGSLDDNLLKLIEEIKKGHMIPLVVYRYYPQYKAFCYLKGLRVVRVAVHSELWNRGIGSWILARLEDEAKDERYDWIGAGFGSSYELVNFWIKNGFIPIALSPRPNKVSGEFSAVVVKPITVKARELLEHISREFRLRLIESLHDPYFIMDSYTVVALLSKGFGDYKAKAEFKGAQRLRLESYIRGVMPYEGASDAIKALVRAHFLTVPERRLRLTQEQERLLVLKVLQGREWHYVARILSKKRSELLEQMKSMVKMMLEEYG